MNKWANFNKDSENRLIENQANKFDMTPDEFVNSQGHGATPYRPESIDYFGSASEPSGVNLRDFAKTFDPSDINQVKQFQEMAGLEVDGMFGPKSEAALREVQGLGTQKDPFGHGVEGYTASEPSHSQPNYVEKPASLGIRVGSYNPDERANEDYEREAEAYNEQASSQARYGFQYPMK